MVTTLDEVRHGLETGDYVTFTEVKGMEPLNDCEPMRVTETGASPPPPHGPANCWAGPRPAGPARDLLIRRETGASPPHGPRQPPCSARSLPQSHPAPT